VSVCDRQTDRQTGRQTDRQTDKDREIDIGMARICDFYVFRIIVHLYHDNKYYMIFVVKRSPKNEDILSNMQNMHLGFTHDGIVKFDAILV
jgi:hypothetical protein